MLAVGSVSLSAILFCLPALINEAGFNAMEFSQISALTTWAITLVILFSFTKKTAVRTVESDVIGTNEIDMAISEDVKAQLKDRLLN